MNFLRILLSNILILAVSACASTDSLLPPRKYTSDWCQRDFMSAKGKPTEVQLDRVSDLFLDNCFIEVIHLASFIREQRRDKLYSVSAEIVEVLTPEGSISPYILESFEREFLSLLISTSFLRLNKKERALVELRRSLDEEKAILYNYGSDPVLSLLHAALWDRFDPLTARPLWKKLSEYNRIDPKVRQFALQRVNEIDRNANDKIIWRIIGTGQLPALDWRPVFFSKHSNLYQISTRSPFPPNCSSLNTVIFATSSWNEKIARRSSSEYHPLVYAKSVARFPVGVLYGVLGVSAGLGVGFGGCVVAAKAEDTSGQLCARSLEVGMFLASQATNLVSYTLKPDLRRWQNLPSAFIVTREAAQETSVPCIPDAPGRTMVL